MPVNTITRTGLAAAAASAVAGLAAVAVARHRALQVTVPGRPPRAGTPAAPARLPAVPVPRRRYRRSCRRAG